eukprot:1761536-Alexandrium_andersonii.AAC.1
MFNLSIGCSPKGLPKPVAARLRMLRMLALDVVVAVGVVGVSVRVAVRADVRVAVRAVIRVAAG